MAGEHPTEATPLPVEALKGFGWNARSALNRWKGISVSTFATEPNG
jgi:hypothetical protein